jgi:hypothetical protein
LTVYSNTEARHSAQRVVQYLENLKDVEDDREGTHSSSAASNLWFCLLTLWFLRFVVLTALLAAAQKVLSEEKASRSAADRSLAQENTAWQITKQPLQTSVHYRANLARNLELVQASFTATTSRLTSKSSALDTAVIQEHEMEIKLKAAKEKLKAAKEQIKSQGQVLDTAQEALSKRVFSSSAVANAMALVKNHSRWHWAGNVS